MIHILIYFALLVITCGYAVKEGGQPERLASLAIALGVVATYLLPFDPTHSFRSVELPELLIDIVALAAFVAIAAVANRFWPMWLAALHLVGVGIHGVKGYEPNLLPTIYAAASGKIGYGLLIIIAAGVYRHQARIARYGKDKDWSWGAV